MGSALQSEVELLVRALIVAVLIGLAMPAVAQQDRGDWFKSALCGEQITIYWRGVECCEHSDASDHMDL